MKKSLGNIFLLLIMIQTYLSASQLATYKLTANKDDVFVKEPLKIEFVAKQQNHTDNMFFLLKPKNNKNYEIELLQKTIKDKKHHNTQTTFTYILFPLVAGDITVSFDFTIQIASDKAVAQSYVDDHDDSIAIQMINKQITIKPLHIHVKNIPANAKLIGDFTLNSTQIQKEVTKYDDISVIYTIKGTGYKNDLKDILPDISDVTKFSEIKNISSKLTKAGYETKKIYTYALSCKKDFTLPALNIQAYSPKKHKLYTLYTKASKIKVKPIDPNLLRDKKDFPKDDDLFEYQSIKKFIIYLSIFCLGFITAKIKGISLQKHKNNNKFHDIKQTKSAQELILVLINNYKDEDLNIYIDKLEQLAYNNSKSSFTQIKGEILSQVKNST